MKTRGKNKIFKCLRPATADDGYFKHSKSCDSFDVQEYYNSSSGSEQGGGRGGDGGAAAAAAGDPKILRHFSMRKAADQSSDKSSAADDPNVRKGKFRGKFRRVLKAVFFEASLLRKLRKTDSIMAPFRSGSSSSLSSSSSSSSSKPRRISRSESFSSRGHTESSDKICRMNSDSSSRLSALSLMTAREFSSSSSPCSSALCYSPATCCLDRNRSISSSSSSRTKQQKLAVERGRRRYCWKVGCCCLILCLLALLFWGKALAILFISAWLYFAPLCFKPTFHPPPVFQPNDCIMTRNKFHHARRLSGF